MNETSFLDPRHGMEVKVYIPLSKNAVMALRKLADQERRDPRQQASWIIESELIRRGLITEHSEINETENAKVEEALNVQSTR